MLDRRGLEQNSNRGLLRYFPKRGKRVRISSTKLRGESGYVAAIEARHDAAAATFDSRTVDKAPRV